MTVSLLGASVNVSPRTWHPGAIRMSKYPEIDAINSQYHYQDTHKGGAGDWGKVSCGQHGNYNELAYILEHRLLPEVGVGKKAQAIAAIEKTCRLRNGTSRTEFYASLEKELNIKLPDPKHPEDDARTHR